MADSAHGPDSSPSDPGGPEPLGARVDEPRFVVLRHTMPGGDHYDLMFECDGVLATWRSPCPLSEIGAKPVRLTRIGDHRLAYLEYEGPLSGNRGHVERVERGRFAGQSQLAGRDWRIDVRGELTCGAFRIGRDAGASWLITTATPVDAADS